MELYDTIRYSEEKKKLDNLLDNSIRKVVSNQNLEKYFDYYNESRYDSLKVTKAIGYNILLCKENIKAESWKNYNIIHYEDANKYPELLSSDVYNNLEYDNMNNAYFIVFDKNKNRVIFCLIDNNKIISFFGKGILTYEDDLIVPNLLNIKQDDYKSIR